LDLRAGANGLRFPVVTVSGVALLFAMSCLLPSLRSRGLWIAFLFALGWSGCGDRERSGSETAAVPAVRPPTVAPVQPDSSYPVILGIDVLEADGFAAIKGKKIGLLTHPAGVNRTGEHTLDVLRRAPGVKIVALFAPEHGLYGEEKAAANVADTFDRRAGLPVYSLHGDNRKPTKEQLAGLDALVIDLQDIGVRSYTFNVVMRYAMDSCFLHGVEVIVLDRPNPLGGVKVSGPILDESLRKNNGVGAFPMPYVHGLTMGELARWAADVPGILDGVSEELRVKGRLTVVPMRGWRRSMRWPETGLRYVPTSPNIPDFEAVVGYAMVGLGCIGSGFWHGIGTPYPFRWFTYPGKTGVQLEKDLQALRVPGLRFRPTILTDPQGARLNGVYAEISNWDAWDPTELSFQLMRLACRYRSPNPFSTLDAKEERTFKIHVGSLAWWDALRRDGARVDLQVWLKNWRAQADAYREQTRKYWLYD
jgi:uncharacterized protein YbbC (DUF1343 family)